MLEPFFLEGCRGRLFCSLHRPLQTLSQLPGQAVLCIPPFAEEMNKSRHMFALLGQQLAAQNQACLLPDLFGTGDSQGDFSEADWDGWLDDLRRCAVWLQGQGVSQLTLLGMRGGALLAMEAHRSLALPVQDVVLWQPVARGKLWLTQFLRIRLAAELLGEDQGGGEKQTTSSLRARFAGGECVEIAGYEMSAALARALDSRNLLDFPPAEGTPVHWLELVASESADIAPVAKKLINQWQAGGADVSVSALTGDSFWMTQEITEAPSLIDQTLEIVTKREAP